MECSICYSQIQDKISMTCSSQHAFCFKCILQYIESNSELKNCPNCRGGSKFIMITGDVVASQDFYSLDYFKKSMPLLQKILLDSVETNTCLISEQLLVTYVKNKKQLEIAHKLMNMGESLETVANVIRWDTDGPSIAADIGNIFSTMFGANRPEINRMARDGGFYYYGATNPRYNYFN